MKSPADLHLPFPDWRPGQRRAIREIQFAPTPIIVVQAPTGSGKSAIVLGAMRHLELRSLVLTATLGLQEQYRRSVDWLADARGMSNYPCLAAQDQFRSEFPRRDLSRVTCDEGPCRVGRECGLKEHGCLYFTAYRQLLGSAHGSTSYAYYLAQRRYGRGLGPIETLLCDEAHEIPHQIASVCAITLPLRDAPKPLPDTIAGWRAWASKMVATPDAPELVDEGRLRARTRRERITALSQYLDADWIWDVGEHAIIFEPVDIRPLMPMLWGQVPTTVLLSATITPSTLDVLGVPDTDVSFHAVPSTFPVAHRPIYLLDGGRIDYRASAETIDRLHEKLNDIIELRPHSKGLIHPISYARQREVFERSPHKALMICAWNVQQLPAAIAEWRQRPAPAVLMSPAIMTGYDFGDADYQIIVKTPFPDTRSPIAKARMKTITRYRELLTAQALMQASGRIVRSATDVGETFVLDEHARWFIKHNQDLFPEYWRAAVQETRRIPREPLRRVG